MYHCIKCNRHLSHVSYLRLVKARQMEKRNRPSVACLRAPLLRQASFAGARSLVTEPPAARAVQARLGLVAAAVRGPLWRRARQNRQSHESPAREPGRRGVARTVARNPPGASGLGRLPALAGRSESERAPLERARAAARSRSRKAQPRGPDPAHPGPFRAESAERPAGRSSCPRGPTRRRPGPSESAQRSDAMLTFDIVLPREPFWHHLR
jgi:hypothetical protein